MKKIVASVFLLVLLMAFSAVLLAEGDGPCKMGKGGMMGGMERPMMGPKMVLAMASELNLTADQMDKIKKIADAVPEKGEVKEGMGKDMEDMKAEMQKDAPDEAKINSMIDKMADAHKAAMKQRVKTMLAVHAVLTKEQRQILKKKMEEKKEKMGKRMEKMKNMDDK